MIEKMSFWTKKKNRYLCRILCSLLFAVILLVMSPEKAAAKDSSSISISSPVSNTNYALNKPIDLYFDIYDPYSQSNIQAFVYLEIWKDGKKDTESAWGYVEKNSRAGNYQQYAWMYGGNKLTLTCNQSGTYTFKIICKPYNTDTKKLDTGIKESDYPMKSVTFTVGDVSSSTAMKREIHLR